MIRVQTTTVDSNPNMTKDMRKRIAQLQRAYVTIGVHEDAGHYTAGRNPPDVVEVALWNEFGTRNTPERSFLRSSIDGNEQLINSWVAEAVDKVMLGTTSVERALESIGFKVQVLIQNKIKSNVPPPNAPSTVKHKEHEGVAPSTLIETGLLLRSITYKVHA